MQSKTKVSQKDSRYHSNPARYHRIPFPLVLFRKIPCPHPKQPNPKCAVSKYFLKDNIFIQPRYKSNIADSFLLLAVKHFISGQAVYLDYMVANPIFQKAIPVIALSNPMLLNAIGACGAYNLGRKIGKMKPIQAAAEYYKEANTILYLALKSTDPDFEVCLATALLITVYEMGFEITHDLTNHILGVKSLLEEFPVYFDAVKREITFSSPIAQGAFWVLLHCDILAAFLLRSVPLWNPNDWGPLVGLGDTSYYDAKYPDPYTFNTLAKPQNNSHSFQANITHNLKNARNESQKKNDAHYWYRKVIHILFRTCSLRGLGYDPVSPTQFFSMHSFFSARQQLFDELQDVMNSMPCFMSPLFDINTDEKKRAKEARQAAMSLRDSLGLKQSPANTQGVVSNEYATTNQQHSNYNQYQQQRAFSNQTQHPFFSGDSAIYGSSDESSETDERIRGALNGSHPVTFSQVFFTDPIYSIIHAYALSATLALNGVKPSQVNFNFFGNNPMNQPVLNDMDKFVPMTIKIKQPSDKFSSFSNTDRLTFGFEESRAYARRLVSIIISSSHYFQIGGMTAWGFIFAQPYISDPQEREYILAYFDRLCSIGWSVDRIKVFLESGWYPGQGC